LRLRLLQYADFRTDYAQGLEELLDTVGVEQQAAASAAAASTIPEASQPAAPDTQQNPLQRLVALASAEQAQRELQEIQRRAAAEKARLEQAESRRVEEERSRGAKSPALLSIEALLTLKGHNSPVSSVAWSPDGQRLATASYDKTAKVW
jgi:hypothetical protein